MSSSLDFLLKPNQRRRRGNAVLAREGEGSGGMVLEEGLLRGEEDGEDDLDWFGAVRVGSIRVNGVEGNAMKD